MTKYERAALAAMEAVFVHAGWPCRVDRAEKHVVLRVKDPRGGEHKLPVAGSPRSDLKCQTNFGRQKAQRLIHAWEEQHRRGVA
jgi:hypothetical protein